MIRRDIPLVVEAERATYDFAWTEEDFLRCLRQSNCIGMVATLDDAVVGYMIYELYRNEIVVLNFAVHPSYRRCGVGSQMVAKLISKLAPIGRTRIRLEVREGNLEAQLFFRAHGFRATQVLRSHFDDTGEDGYLMVYHIPEDKTDEVEFGGGQLAQPFESNW
jgi:ribosomal-protein-alanine N-acetyltransferase